MRGKRTFRVEWDVIYRRHPTGVWYDNHDQILEDHQVRLRGRILDIGCGDGRNVKFLSSLACQVFCLDQSECAVRLAQQRHNCVDISYIAASADSLPFDDGSFDTIVAVDLLGHAVHPKRVIAEIRRTIKTRGRLIGTAYTPRDVAFAETSKRSVIHEGVLYRCYHRKELYKMISSSFHVESMLEKRWTEPPHGDVRPYTHEHSSWCFLARA